MRADLLSPACFCCFSSRRRDSCHESEVKVAAGFRLSLNLVHVFWWSRTNRVVFFSLVDQPHKKEPNKTTRGLQHGTWCPHIRGFSRKEPWGSSALATALKKSMYSSCKWLKGASKSLEASETKKHRWPAHQSRSTNGGGMFYFCTRV